MPRIYDTLSAPEQATLQTKQNKTKTNLHVGMIERNRTKGCVRGMWKEVSESKVEGTRGNGVEVQRGDLDTWSED